MAVQFPTLSLKTQTARYQALADNTLVPYSYAFSIGYASTLYTKNNSQLNIDYFSFAFQADNNLSISILEIEATAAINEPVGNNLGKIMFEVSYSPILDTTLFVATAPPTIPFAPTDFGNIIYRNMISVQLPTVAVFTAGINDFRRYEPYNYLLKYNQILYMHVGISTTILNFNGSINGSIILHALPTGLKI